MCQLLKTVTDEQTCRPSFFRCGLCGGTARSFKILSADVESGKSRSNFDESESRKKVTNMPHEHDLMLSKLTELAKKDTGMSKLLVTGIKC